MRAPGVSVEQLTQCTNATHALPEHTTDGPEWTEELLARLQRDPRFAPVLTGVTRWADIPVAARLPRGQVGALSEHQGVISYFSTGTTGMPKQISFSEDDWERSVGHRASFLSAMGLCAAQRVGVLISFGPWFSGDHITDALVALGASVLPAGISVAHLPAAVRLFENLGVAAIVTTPSIALSVIALRPRLDLERLILVGEHLSPKVRSILGSAFGVEPLSLYASSEAIIGYEAPGYPGEFRWDPEHTFLEVRDSAGRVTPTGVGELVVTRRFGTAMPLLRYRLGDLVELERTPLGHHPRLRFRGRLGQDVGLATGVRLNGQQLHSWLDCLGRPISQAEIRVDHMINGRDNVSISLAATGPKIDEGLAAATFRGISPEVADAVECGYVDVTVRSFCAPATAKRRLRVVELPWRL